MYLYQKLLHVVRAGEGTNERVSITGDFGLV
jgi:hypothetical protein